MVDIFVFINRENFMLSWNEHEKKCYNLGALAPYLIHQNLRVYVVFSARISTFGTIMCLLQ